MPRAGPGSPEHRLLLAVLTAARERGFLGPGDPAAHLHHAVVMARVAEGALGADLGPESFCDLGTGGGVPGLVMAVRWPASRCTMVESSRRRCESLRESVGLLGVDDRVEIIEARAEEVARDERWRERFPLVVARSFGVPPVTAEVAAGLVEVGGLLVVSEAPEGADDRWPAGELGLLGFAGAEIARQQGASFAVVRKTEKVADRWPRRVGIPAKRPLW